MPVTDELGGARRILLHGVTGSGKSTLAAAISGRLGIPWVDLDHLNWRPGWTEVPREELLAEVVRLAEQEAWVFDTAYSGVREPVLARAEVVVALDYPARISSGRLLRRTVRRVATRERVCHGNVETVRRALGRDSILRWHVRALPRKRQATRAMCESSQGPPVLVLRHPREAERLLASLAG